MEDARGSHWTKLIFNPASNAICSLTGLSHSRACVHEDIPVGDGFHHPRRQSGAAALGAAMETDPADLLENWTSVAVEHKPSMLQDVLSRRAIKIASPNGNIVRLGKETGVPRTYNRAVWALAPEARHHGSCRDLAAELGTIRRRNRNIRGHLAEGDLDVLVVAASKYTSFEGGIRWVSGFPDRPPVRLRRDSPGGKAHRRLPREDRWVGQHAEAWDGRAGDGRCAGVMDRRKPSRLETHGVA